MEKGSAFEATLAVYWPHKVPFTGERSVKPWPGAGSVDLADSALASGESPWPYRCPVGA